jgi:hypothetical protein
MSQTSQDLENRRKCTAVQTRYKADAPFVHTFLALIYAVPFGLNSPSCQSEPNGSTCSQSAWKMSLSHSTPGREVLLPKNATCIFATAYNFSKLNTGY